MTDSHGITVSHVPLDGVGARIHRPGDVPINDVNLFDLREVHDAVEESLEQTKASLHGPNRELSEATRGALLAIDKIAYHLESFHRALQAGAVNYPPE
jgi:hypothetical protein